MCAITFDAHSDGIAAYGFVGGEREPSARWVAKERGLVQCDKGVEPKEIDRRGSEKIQMGDVRDRKRLRLQALTTSASCVIKLMGTRGFRCGSSSHGTSGER